MDRSNVTLDRIRTFVRVAERGAFSAVARESGVGQSSVTRRLRELEEALGVVLLSRTTRRVALTDEGRRFYESAVQILQLVDYAADEISSARGALAGAVRISCTAALGVRHVSRLIFEFQDRHPEIVADLSLTDERIDLVRQGVDVAVRLGPLTDSSMKRRVVGLSRRSLVASPAYLARHGRPTQPEHLGRHQAIRMANIVGSDSLALEGKSGERHAIALRGTLQVDHGLAAREALLASRGFAPAHVWLVDDLLEDGRLETILPNYTPAAVPLNILIAPERTSVARVRLLVDFLANELSRVPGLSRA